MQRNYETLKTKLRASSHFVAYGAGLVAVLLLGMSIGRGAAPKTESSAPKVNYSTTKQADAETATTETVPQTATAQVAGTETKTNAPCVVKGNISSKSKIYHVQGGAFYDRTQAEVCFATEAEAVAAGFRKSTR